MTESATIDNAAGPVISEATATETPTQILKRSGNRLTVQAANGRIIEVEKLTALGFYKLTKALGEYANNEATANYALLAASVRKIDQTPYAMPAKDRDVEWIIQLLDFEGMAAVADALKTLSTPEAEVETAKN